MRIAIIQLHGQDLDVLDNRTLGAWAILYDGTRRQVEQAADGRIWAQVRPSDDDERVGRKLRAAFLALT